MVKKKKIKLEQEERVNEEVVVQNKKNGTDHIETRVYMHICNRFRLPSPRWPPLFYPYRQTQYGRALPRTCIVGLQKV